MRFITGLSIRSPPPMPLAGSSKPRRHQQRRRLRKSAFRCSFQTVSAVYSMLRVMMGGRLMRCALFFCDRRRVEQPSYLFLVPEIRNSIPGMLIFGMEMWVRHLSLRRKISPKLLIQYSYWYYTRNFPQATVSSSTFTPNTISIACTRSVSTLNSPVSFESSYQQLSTTTGDYSGNGSGAGSQLYFVFFAIAFGVDTSSSTFSNLYSFPIGLGVSIPYSLPSALSQ